MLGEEHAQRKGHATGHPLLTDAETGLANSLHFDLVYSYLFAAGYRGLSFTLLMLSVGGGQKLAGDLPRAVGQKIQTMTRDSDLVAHAGGGRFVVMLLGTNLQGARIAADRIEMSLADVVDGAVSFGLAAYDNSMREASALLEAAETALSAAEAAGGGLEYA